MNDRRRAIAVALAAVAPLLGVVACSGEDGGSLADKARETASSVKDQATSQLDDAATDQTAQATGLAPDLQSSIDDVRQQAEQVAGDVAAEGDKISEPTRQAVTDLQERAGQVDEQLSSTEGVSSAVTAAWDAFLRTIEQLAERVGNAGG